MDLLKKKKKKLLLIYASTDKTIDDSKQAFQPNDNQNDFKNTNENLTEETNAMATTVMEGTNQKQSAI